MEQRQYNVNIDTVGAMQVVADTPKHALEETIKHQFPNLVVEEIKAFKKQEQGYYYCEVTLLKATENSKPSKYLVKVNQKTSNTQPQATSNPQTQTTPQSKVKKSTTNSTTNSTTTKQSQPRTTRSKSSTSQTKSTKTSKQVSKKQTKSFEQQKVENSEKLMNGLMKGGKGVIDLISRFHNWFWKE